MKKRKLFLNNILIFIIPIVLISCENEILKSDYDYQQDATKLPDVSLVIGEVTGASVSCTADMSFKGDFNIIEKGFVCSKNLEFTNGVISKPIKTTNFQGALIGLDELTDYYVKAYVITKNGTAYSDLQIITTTKFINPLLPYCGKYVESDYVYSTNELEAVYLVELSSLKSNPIQLTMRNFWGGDTAVVIDFNLPAKTFSLTPSQPIYVDKNYGDIFAYPILNRAVDMSGTSISGIVGSNGTLTIAAWAAANSYGNFGIYNKSTLIPATNLLAGTYSETDYNFADGSVIGQHPDTVLISPVSGDLNKVLISRLWLPKKSSGIYASVDFEEGILSIDKQVIYSDPVKGDLYICALNENGTPNLNSNSKINVVWEEDGSLTIKNWGIANSSYTVNTFSKTTLTLPASSNGIRKKKVRLLN